MAPHSSTPAWDPMDGGAWWAAVHGVTEGRTRLSDPLEKELTNRFSILALEISRTEEPVRLQSMMSQKLDVT